MTGQIASALVSQSYTSVEIIVEEDVERLLALRKMDDLKPGAKIALRKKLHELKVGPMIVLVKRYDNTICMHAIRMQVFMHPISLLEALTSTKV